MEYKNAAREQFPLTTPDNDTIFLYINFTTEFPVEKQLPASANKVFIITMSVAFYVFFR